MNCGKAPGNVLKRSVVNLIGKGPRTGVDAAVFETTAGYFMSASAMGSDDNGSTELAVFKACNNIWAAGGTVCGVEAVFILPSHMREIRLKELTRRIIAACTKCNTILSGGHTEISDAVNTIVVTITAVGTSTKDKITSIHNVKPGLDIIATKWMGIEESVLIMNNAQMTDRLYTRFTPSYFDNGIRYMDTLSVEAEALIATDCGARVMHDVSDGGIFGALWDMAEGAGMGFEIELKKIPMLQEIVEITGFFGINTYRCKSSGSLLIACEDGESVAEKLLKEQIPAVVIGKFTDSNNKIIRNDDEVRYLERT